MRTAGHTVLVAALVVAAVAFVPGGAMAADGLDVSGDQTDDGTVDVTVTQNGSAVANATVTVEAVNNTTYAGTGTYETDENGTLGLVAPEQNVTVNVTASADNATGSTTLDLVAPTDEADLSVAVSQATDGSATVSVTNATGAGVANASVAVTAVDNATYAGSGDYTADENGTVDLPAPEQNVTVDVTASANDRTASTTTTLTVAEEGDENETDSFGARVSAYVGFLQANGNMSGHAVAEFVTANNPGADNRPDHVDPGPKDDGDEADEEDESEDGDDADTEDDERGNGNGNGNAGNNGNGNNGNGNGNGNPGNGNGPP
ncbi:hypothetical protein [Halobacterium litoreum]|uniref:Calx-beta domain-containing protein n=1 Tax=Halobacterium litoreum TaxID=2039234 RepID=A0ABD5NFH4_9EURY|nr:hypothetical protein [Halobacterium litoreum]UHH13156.1 hypothetical protein LT972_13490 [Halobacterium litoreum]